LTSYSVLPSGPRATVIATWPGEWADYSAKVTTLTDIDQASELAHALTRLSEGAWDAAAWLDTYPAIEAGLTTLVEQLRSPVDKIEEIHLPDDAYRHTDQWSFTDVKDLLATELPVAVNVLTRAQRLTIADELSADATSRTDALHLLPSGQDPAATAKSARCPKALPRGWSAVGARTARPPNDGPPATGWSVLSNWSPPARRMAAGPGRKTTRCSPTSSCLTARTWSTTRSSTCPCTTDTATPGTPARTPP
jgi:hypothetical protein